MRALRVILASLLVAGPVRADVTSDPLWTLFSSYAVAPDEKAPEGEGDAKGLAALQADLLLLADGFEAFRDEGQAKENLERLKPRMTPALRPFFKDRASALDVVYRTLAVTDYTWALRLPEPPCGPADRRAALLGSEDRLFAEKDGKSSAWLAALLGEKALDREAADALDRASARVRLTAADYERRRAAARRMTIELERAEGAERARLYCERAFVYERLAAHQRSAGDGLVEAGRVERASSDGSVLLVEGGGRRVAATIVTTPRGGRFIVTDAAALPAGETPRVFAPVEGGSPLELPATVERRHPTLSLAVLSVGGVGARPGEPLTGAAPATGDLVEATGHSAVSGLWTRSSGLVTKADAISFQTDAAVSAEFSGGPVRDESGKLAGILITHPAHTEEKHWPVGVPAALIAAWLDGTGEPVAAPAPADIEDAGTAAILSRAAPAPIEAGLGDWHIPSLPPPPPEPRGVCVKYCDGPPRRSSSYSSSGSSSGSSSAAAGAEIGQALGKALAPAVEALIFKGIPALFRGIASLFGGGSRAKPVAPQIRRAPTPQVVQKEPEPPKPDIKCQLQSAGTPASIRAEVAVVRVQLTCKDNNGIIEKVDVSNQTISFTLGWEGKSVQYERIEAVTDADGFAEFSFRVDNEIARAERSFESMDKYDPEKRVAPLHRMDSGPELQNAGRDLIETSDTRPAVAEKKKPSDDKSAVLALTGFGVGIRMVARQSARRVATVGAGRLATAAATGAATGATRGAITGPQGALIGGAATLVLSVAWELAGSTKNESKPEAKKIPGTEDKFADPDNAEGEESAEREQEREEYLAYKKRCNEKEPMDIPLCDRLLWRIRRDRDCVRMREDWDRKWTQRGKKDHDGETANRKTAINSTLKSLLRNNCPETE